MKKITFILSFLFAFSTIGYSQVSGYGFTETTETYAQITGTTSTATGDDGTQTNIPIGFNFNFGGVDYTAFGISTNGIIRLGSSAANTTIGTGWVNELISSAPNRPLIAPFWDDNHLSTGTIRYSLTGSAPNQVLTVNWHNMKVGGGGSTAGASVSMLLRLYETTNIIEIVYGDPFTTTNAVTASVGLNDMTSFLSVTPAVSSTVSSATANNGITAAGMANLAGKKLIFSPPSCPAPTGVVVSNVTTTTADFSWTPGGSEFDWEYLILPAGSPAPTGSGIDIDSDSFTEFGLSPATAYAFWIRAYCSFSEQSSWVGPFNFTTPCDSFNTFPFTETFENASPSRTCWTNVQVAGAANWTYAAGSSGGLITTAFQGTLNARFVSVSGANTPITKLVSPVFDMSALTNPRLKFHYAQEVWFGDQNQLKVYYRISSSDPWVEIAHYTTNVTAWTEVILTLPNPSANYQIAFEGINNFGRANVVDNVIVEETPVFPPSCATNIVATPNATCGNFANSITWDAAAGADGYYLTIGTTPGGNQVADGIEVFSTSYNFTGTINTTYYYTIVPFNANGPATGCVEQSFTTNANGCYCVSEPTSVDGTGITNVQIGTTDFPNTVSTPPVYSSNVATPVDMVQGINNNVQITFNVPSFGGNSYDYSTVIWIDFNDDFVLDASEIVFTGLSTTVGVPTLLNASFVMPLSAPLGQHRMRIVATDAVQTPANPCYSGTWGETVDFTVNIIVATCTPPTVATSTVVADCGNSQYSVNVDVTSLGNGTPVITDGTTNWAVSSTGVITVGPFADATSVTLTLLHGSDATCDLPLGNFNNICPPTNDTCATAIPVDCNDVVTGSTANGATNTGGNTAADVWYSYSGDAGDITLSLCANTNFDSYLRVYDACGGTQIAFNDDGCGAQSTLTFTADGTSTYYIMVEGFGSNTGNFELTVTCVLNTDSFDNNNFMVYPNPVKDVLNLSYTSEISTVRVMNMLGQEVISRKLNSANAQVDMSQLSAGTYIVNVTIGDTVKTIKVVKQ